MVIGTPFVAYDVYRAECTRYGVRDVFGKVSSPGSCRFTLGNDDLYLEFGEPARIQHGLPDGMASRDGLAAEVHVHLWISSLSGSSDQEIFRAENLRLGYYKQPIAPDQPIDAAAFRALHSVLQIPGAPEAANRYSDFLNMVGSTVFAQTTPTDLTVYSCCANDPAVIEKAVRESALCVVVAPASKTGSYYNGATACTLHLTGSYKPYVEILYGTVKPEVERQRPGNNSYANPHLPITLSWAYQYGTGLGGNTAAGYHYQDIVGGAAPPLQSSEIQLRVKGEEAVETIEVPGPAQELALPEAYYAGDFDWRVRVKALDILSDEMSWQAVTTRDAIPTVRALRPKNEYVDASVQAEFSWEYSIATGTAPTGYEIGALDGGEWRTLASGSESAATSATIPAGQLSSTISAWRVRACNVDGVYSEWSEAAEVILRVAPIVAELTVTGNTRPALSWQAADQQGWEAAVDGKSAGVRYGAQKAFDWPEILDDGAHEVAVRVVNRFGLFSPWKSVRHEVRNAPPFAAGATAAVAAGCSVRVSWPVSGAARVEIFRDGVRAAVVEDGARSWTDQRGWTDQLTAGRHTYRVRLVDASGLYTDLVPAQAAPRLRRAVIAQEGVWDWVELGWIAGAEPPSRSSAYAPVYALQTYSGHALPVAEVSAHRTATHTLSYTVDGEDAARLVQLVGQRAVFKRDGEVLRGLITGAQEVREWFGHTVTLTMAEVEDL